MMECRQSAVLADAWETRGELSPQELRELESHLATCPDCSAAYGALLPFIRRDCGQGEALAQAFPGSGAELATQVLGALSRRPRRPGTFLFAAAAAAIFIAGIGLGLALGHRGQGDSVSVLFVLEAPEARSVSLAGDFNRWSPGQDALQRRAPGKAWELRLKLPKGRAYAYNFIIDGRLWIPDPIAPEKVDDGFGGTSSLLRL
jgi:hypothetical protein